MFTTPNDQSTTQACPQPERPQTPYESHERAINEWHEACRDFARAEQRKTKAGASLEKCNQMLAEHIQRLMIDPTQNQNKCVDTAYIGAGQIGGIQKQNY